MHCKVQSVTIEVFEWCPNEPKQVRLSVHAKVRDADMLPNEQSFSFDVGEMLMVMVIVRQMGQSICKMARLVGNASPQWWVPS